MKLSRRKALWGMATSGLAFVFAPWRFFKRRKPGVYNENIDTKNKRVHLKGMVRNCQAYNIENPPNPYAFRDKRTYAVGKGRQFRTIQSAIDAIPDDLSASGVYTVEVYS